MDPPATMSDGRYNLAEIWQYPMSESGISRGQFGHGLAQFGDPSREVSGNDPVSLEQQQRRGGMRRRRDGEDETAKVVSTSSTSSGNAVARREKISERMKILQDLVPGCNKVIGKALVLDEIINYIQSLQRQVEFLSMKLEAVNSGINPAIEVFPRKDYGQQAFDATGMAFGSQVIREYSGGTSPEWLHIGSAFERTT
ncbi:hypothetical protein Golob_007394 [Gossypium lobatum]|uniref:BHLH domain-containing protein n=1 Tax=Gossypium lobatum TaxID=34289 RepID=A0A7J8MCC4_9ROSI|nr:hypothetical protein [Gossypium lobatum]